MADTIKNGANTPLNQVAGTVPQMEGALLNWFQPMTFSRVTKSVNGFEVTETMEEISFFGVIQPFSSRDLMLKPEGERAWTWWTIHASPSLKLQVDDVINYISGQYRVMKRTDYTVYGYIKYEVITDFTGSGPTPG